MLKQITITNYRSCVRTFLDLSTNLSVLIGANGSGKTNILNAIMLLKTMVSRFQERQRSGVSTSALDARFQPNEISANLHAEVSILTDDSNNDVVQRISEQWNVTGSSGLPHYQDLPLVVTMQEDRHAQMVAFFQRGLESPDPMATVAQTPDDIKIGLRAIGRFCSGMKYYGASQFTNPGACGVSFEIGEDGRMFSGLRTRHQNHTQILHEMYRASCEPNNSNYQQFIDIVGPQGLKMIDELSFKRVLTSSSETLVHVGGDIERRKNKRYLIVPTVRIGKRQLSPNQLSEGTFKTLVLLFHIMTAESSALLIEEPEVCIHHGLLSSVLELIKIHSREKVIILTTHSDFVLDQVDPENVHHVTFSRSKGTQVRHIPNSMSGQEYEALRKFLRTQGSLGEYWRAGALTETP